MQPENNKARFRIFAQVVAYSVYSGYTEDFFKKPVVHVFEMQDKAILKIFQTQVFRKHQTFEEFSVPPVV